MICPGVPGANGVARPGDTLILGLVEQYREALRLPQVQDRPDEFRRWLTEAREKAEGLETTLRPSGRRDVDRAAAEAAFQAAGAVCTHCHARYRDVPRRR